MSKIYNLNIISSLLSYTIEDVCILYSKRKLHPQTVRKWIKNGLQLVDHYKPALLHGSNLKDFLGKLNDNSLINLNFDEFYCFSCKEAHIPLHREIYIDCSGQFIKATGVCPKTKKIMKKSYKLADYPELKKFFNLVEKSRLYDSLNTGLETQIEDNKENQKTESEIKQGEFNYE